MISPYEDDLDKIKKELIYQTTYVFIIFWIFNDFWIKIAVFRDAHSFNKRILIF